MIAYRNVAAAEVNRGLFAGFVRRQVVTLCWRREGGRWTLRDDPFVDDWSEDDYRALLEHLRGILSGGGLVRGAFLGGRLKGFASVSAQPYGAYLDLTQLYVSAELRRQGVGRALFLAAADWARARGAGKLYISAHSAAESQAFYRAMGCVEAQAYMRHHVEAEPFDCQLEYGL